MNLLKRLVPSIPCRRIGKPLLEEAIRCAKVVEVHPMARVSKLFGVSHGLREHLARSHDQAAGDAFLKASKYIDELDRKLYPVPEVAKGSKAHKQAQVIAQPLDPEAIQLRVKLRHASAYFKSLHQALSDGLVTAPVSVSRLVESTLLGSASERLAEHISLFGPSMSEESLQVCLHSYFESEVATALFILQTLPPIAPAPKQPALPIHKKCWKRISKLSRVYLLDHLELNSKCRCIYTWSADIKGKDGLPPDTQPMEVLLHGRKAFFPEGETVCAHFLQQLVKEEAQLDDERAEWTGYARKGSVFLVVTMVLDWIVCSL